MTNPADKLCLCGVFVLVDYILMDPAERQRLHINSIPRPFPQRATVPPVPWSQSYREAKDWLRQHLFTVNAVALKLQECWINEYGELFLCTNFNPYSVLLELDQN